MAAGGAVIWATPIVLSSPAAAAVTSCGDTPRLLDFDTFANNTYFSSAMVGPIGVTITATPDPGTTTLVDNGRVKNGPSGGVSGRYLRFEMVPNAVGRQQTITITFDSPVSNLSIPLFDIDNTTPRGSRWSDRIIVTTTGYTYSVPAGSTVIGIGTSGNPFRNSHNNDNVDYTSNGGNLVLGHPGPLMSFTFIYRNGPNVSNGNQYVGLGDLSFTC
jgi:hypothetical protein